MAMHNLECIQALHPNITWLSHNMEVILHNRLLVDIPRAGISLQSHHLSRLHRVVVMITMASSLQHSNSRPQVVLQEGQIARVTITTSRQLLPIHSKGKDMHRMDMVVIRHLSLVMVSLLLMISNKVTTLLLAMAQIQRKKGILLPMELKGILLRHHHRSSLQLPVSQDTVPVSHQTQPLLAILPRELVKQVMACPRLLKLAMATNRLRMQRAMDNPKPRSHLLMLRLMEELNSLQAHQEAIVRPLVGSQAIPSLSHHRQVTLSLMLLLPNVVPLQDMESHLMVQRLHLSRAMGSSHQHITATVVVIRSLLLMLLMLVQGVVVRRVLNRARLRKRRPRVDYKWKCGMSCYSFVPVLAVVED